MPHGGRNLAAVASSSDNPSGRESKVASISGILFGVFLVATFASTYNFPAAPAQADATLAQFSSLRTAFLAGNGFIGLAAVFAVPYFIGLRSAFNGKDRLLVGSATLLALAGIVVTAVVFITATVALDVLSTAYATGGVTRTAAVIVAQAVIGLGSVEIFGFLVLAAGLGVYGFVTMRGKPFPRWLGYGGILAAILSLVAAAPVSGAFSALIAGVVLILVWTFGTSGLMWRSRAP